MYRLLIAAALLAVATVIVPFPSLAQQACMGREWFDANRDPVAVQVMLAVTAIGSTIEVFQFPDGSWTMFETSPAKVTCFMASGRMMAVRPPEWSDEEPPS